MEPTGPTEPTPEEQRHRRRALLVPTIIFTIVFLLIVIPLIMGLLRIR